MSIEVSKKESTTIEMWRDIMEVSLENFSTNLINGCKFGFSLLFSITLVGSIMIDWDK